MKSTTALFAILALSTSLSGCAFDEDGLEDEPEIEEAEAAVRPRAHLFMVEAKSFIAPIASSMVGTLGDPITDAALNALAVATNASFSENPTTGAHSAGQFRVWAHVELDVICDGTRATMMLANPLTDVGFEGPLKGELDSISASATGSSFSFQAAGRPHQFVEPTFQAVYPRTNRTIWYRVDGHVACDQNSEAFITVDSVTSTDFPSVRVFASRITGGVVLPEAQIFEWRQGKFTELWFLLPKPPF
jgi:hypothetical protein